MSVIAEFTVPAEQFALYETLCAVPGMTVEIERVVAHDPDRIMPYFWTSGGDYDAFETAARNDPSVEDLTRVDTLDDAVLYRATWIRNVESVVYAYTESEAVLLEATGRDDQWRIQLRFDEETDVTGFNEYVTENDLAIDLKRLYHPSHPTSESHPQLTEKQRQAIGSGLESGYYEIPRETGLGELAAELGISRQALSKRFRRAHRTLAENAVEITPPKGE